MKKVLFMLMFLPALAFADVPRGEKLVQRLWKDMQESNVDAIKQYTSKNFQSLHWFGAFNRYQELDLIKNLHIVSYELRDIKATQGDNCIVVTYNVLVTESIQESQFTSLAPRLSVWKKVGNEWKWVAHANLATPFQNPS